MSTKRPKKPAPKHKPRKMVAFPPDLYEAMAGAAQGNSRPTAYEIHFACREYLARIKGAQR